MTPKRTITAIALLALVPLYWSAFLMLGGGLDPRGQLIEPGHALNRHIVRQLDRYLPGTEFRQLPPGEMGTSVGTTRDIRHLGQVFFRGDPSRRSYCLGLTFEVLLGACEDCAQAISGQPGFQLGNIDLYGFRGFRRAFYEGAGAPGAGGRSMIDALASHDLGQEITNLDDARPGDLVQMSRNNGSSHAAVFLGWEYNNQDQRVALHHWGVQRGHIGEAIEYLGTGRENLNPNRIFIVRAYLPNLPEPR